MENGETTLLFVVKRPRLLIAEAKEKSCRCFSREWVGHPSNRQPEEESRFPIFTEPAVLLDKISNLLFLRRKGDNMIIAQSAGWSDIGKVRRTNEDSYLLNEAMGLYVVADGMGGHRGGDVASRMAIDAIEQYLSDPSVQAENTTAEGGNENKQNGDRLVQSIRQANKLIYDRSVANETFRGMGTTVSALYLSNNTLITANVGDSPIYLLRNKEIEPLYTPHTLLHERKKIPKSMAGRFSSAKLGHILTRAVGIRSEVKVDFVETPCFKDDFIVICSDGLSNKINKEEIRDIVYQNAVQDACQKMTVSANHRGGEDNITVIVVRIVSTGKDSAGTLFGRMLNIPSRIASFLGIRKRS